MQHSRLKALPCDGTHFALFDYSAVSEEPDTDFARYLTLECGVAAIPVSVFYSGGHSARLVRLCFAKREDTLTQAAERLSRIRCTE